AMRHVRLRKIFLWGFLFVFAAVLISGKGVIVYQSVASRIVSSFDVFLSDDAAVDQDVGYLVRVDNWAAGLSIFMDNPLLGVGPGGYQEQADKMLSSSAVLSDFGLHSDKPYNLYLDILVSYGLVGFAIFFALIAVILYCCLKGSRSGNDPLLQNISFGGAVVIIIMLVKGLTGEVFFESGQLWLFIGLIMSVLNLSANQQFK
ncbi:MAG: O-antigen ligase family protein, partial [Thermodesulfobacteriota bacterium]|nr:O-antigen ligase family protein [Thermodesulfobacteriota bacterium]